MVVLIKVEDPVVSFPGRTGKPRKPVVKDHREPGIGLGIDDCRHAISLLQLTVVGDAFVVDRNLAILSNGIDRFGIDTMALKPHREASDFIPGACIAGEIDKWDGPEWLAGADVCTASENQEGEYHPYGRPPSHLHLLDYARRCHVAQRCVIAADAMLLLSNSHISPISSIEYSRTWFEGEVEPDPFRQYSGTVSEPDQKENMDETPK